MIVVETLLREIFSQIPDVVYTDVNRGENSLKVNFGWGSEKDLILYLKSLQGNKYPLIWLVQGNRQSDSLYTGKTSKRIKLIIAKNSEHKTNINPTVWDTEFVEMLNPLYDKVLKCLERSGVTKIVDGLYDTDRRANYTEEALEDKTYAIDIWNVIVFEANVNFYEKANGEPMCIHKIKF